ncbi:AraC family transcriptional regulator [Magnetospirillum sp. SS-4]|uniref:helix-turn-helix transcriptional regulator n=1 Tax=Magnetospirillum sp. SS-4 TaxID=2681465 RepID=UPI00137D47A7|nr:AraC family transcriptional regulator [Magnetospirillum sp. SS-4]CAA7619032.1 AraC family transcriptional regulatory protein [Magnetospirillum sp. SS-4]
MSEFPWIVSWKLENGMSSHDLAPGWPAQLPKDVGWEAITPVSAGSGICAFSYQGELYQPTAFCADINPVSAFSNEPSIMLRMIESGHVKTILSDNLTETKDNYGFYIIDPSADHAIFNRHNELNKAFIVQVSCSELRKIAGDLSFGPRMDRIFNGHTDFFSATPRMSMALHETMKHIQCAPFSGPFGELYRRGKIIESMALALNDLDESVPTEVRRTISADERKAQLARDILMADLINPPPIENIATQLGISHRRLNMIFKDIFGMTVFSCLVAWRLDLAKSMLERGELSVKQVAYMLGYSHPNNFVYAFRRRFGISPGRWRSKE